MVVNTLKGDLGEVFGIAMDVSLTGNYVRNFINQSGQGILADRMQRALNGFATNLNDLSGAGGTVDRCTAGETLGIRPGAVRSVTTTTSTTPGTPGTTVNSSTGVITTVAVASGITTTTVTVPRATPWSVGNGGGWGDANGATDGTPSLTPTFGQQSVTGVASANILGGTAVAGNGCYFFNPFASAFDKTRFGPTVYTNITGNDSTYGFIGTGQYQGYGTGTYGPSGNLLTGPSSGLQNDAGVINWLYENRYRRISQDTVDITGVVNGTGGVNLPGGPLGWAAGSEYRYYDRFTQYDVLSDRAKNPCSFISNLTGAAFANRANLADQNDVNAPGRQQLTATIAENYSATCNNITNTNTALSNLSRTGVWLDGFGGNSIRTQFRTVSGFGELSLPFTDTINGSFSSRYERSRINLSTPVAAVVTTGALKWEVSKKVQLRVSVGQTFNATDPGCDAGLTSATNGSSTVTGIGLTVVPNVNTSAFTYCNTALNPERGVNYDLGFIFKPTKSLFMTADLWTIENNGRATTISATAMARLLAGQGALGANLSDPDFAKALDGSAGTINCATSDLFHKIDPASGQPLVELIGLDGTVTQACQTPGQAATTTLQGFTGTPAAGLTNQSYALLYNLPSAINAGNLNTRGIDMGVTYQLPGTVLGGRTSMNVDATYLFYLNTAAASYNGVIVGSDAKFRGGRGAPGGQSSSTLRGSLGFQWAKGKNRLSGTMHFFSSVVVDPASFGSVVVQSNSTAAVFTNYNPATSGQQALCTPDNLAALVPDPTLTLSGAGAAGVGEGPINLACNVGNYLGQRQGGRATFDLTYIRQLPGNVTLSITGENLFDTDPPYSRETQYFFPSAGITSLGRTIKVGVRKTFQ